MTQSDIRQHLATAIRELGTVYNALTSGRGDHYSGQPKAVLEAVERGEDPPELNGRLAWLILEGGQMINLADKDSVQREVDMNLGITKRFWAQCGGILASSQQPGVAALLGKFSNEIQFMRQQ